MKKLLLILCFSIIIFSGCSSAETQSAGADNDLVQVDSPNKLLTASDVESDVAYEFAISEEIIENVDTFKLMDNLKIVLNDDKLYQIEYKPLDGEYAPLVEFESGVTEKTITAEEGYYRISSLDSRDETVNVTISIF